MLGFWIIITHLAGAYLTTSEFVHNKAATSTIYALIASVLYIIPFLIFLPGTPLSVLVIFIFRFLAVRFSFVDYLVWARNLLAPKDKRIGRIVKNGKVDTSKATTNQVVSIHVASIALHCVVIAIAIIIL